MIYLIHIFLQLCLPKTAYRDPALALVWVKNFYYITGSISRLEYSEKYAISISRLTLFLKYDKCGTIMFSIRQLPNYLVI